MAGRDWTREELVAGVLAGDRRALARAISLVENRAPGGGELVRRDLSANRPRSVDRRHGAAGRRQVVARRRARPSRARRSGAPCGVVSVDPSSPFTQGALLGDRIRLADHFLDPGVYIRSMGTRGHLGGLAEAALQTLLLLDAAGRDVSSSRRWAPARARSR